jgi:hypothetical protein
MAREALVTAGHDSKCGFKHLTELYRAFTVIDWKSYKHAGNL